MKITEILKSNKEWQKSKDLKEPDFFNRLAESQSPEFLFIGCSDSRVVIENFIDCELGQFFTHRNIGNQIKKNDMSLDAFLNFGLNILKVKNIILCGHTECAAINTVCSGDFGSLHDWLSDIKELGMQSQDKAVVTRQNILKQVENLKVHRHVEGKSDVKVHGMVFKLETGLLEVVE